MRNDINPNADEKYNEYILNLYLISFNLYEVL